MQGFFPFNVSSVSHQIDKLYRKATPHISELRGHDKQSSPKPLDKKRLVYESNVVYAIHYQCVVLLKCSSDSPDPKNFYNVSR